MISRVWLWGGVKGAEPMRKPVRWTPLTPFDGARDGVVVRLMCGGEEMIGVETLRPFAEQCTEAGVQVILIIDLVMLNDAEASRSIEDLQLHAENLERGNGAEVFGRQPSSRRVHGQAPILLYAELADSP